MIVLIGIGLLAGVVTSISPCVLPVLPILLAGGASGRKPLRIVAGLVASFVVFTLFAAWILNELGLPDDLLRNIAIALLFVVAATLLVPQLGLLLERPFARLTRFRAGGGGFVLGASLGLVFVPCAGPVLATITVVAATNNVGWRAVVLTVAYAIGAAIPMLAIAFGGRTLSSRLRVQGPRLRIASGAVIAVVALGIALNWDTRFQTALPGYTQALQKHIEDTSAAQKALSKVHHTKTLTAAPSPNSKLPSYGVAPALHPGGQWFNTKPLTLSELRGKVVLIDFWTYSCINCLRTLPHLKAWYASYHKDGLVIIGVHTPEFAFEHVASNVSAAVKRLGITYPVVQDNNYATWTAYSNQYWPAEYLIDQKGDIRHVSFGEGEYSQTEDAIRTLLGVKGGRMTQVPNETPTELTTPESYLGYARLARYAGSKLHTNSFATYTFPTSLAENELAYDGGWKVESQRIVAGKNAGLRLHFHADDVYLVLGGRGSVGVSVNGKQTSTVDVNAYRLYTLRSSKRVDDAVMQLRFTPGVQAYAFTFG
jgi:cytochrome c biogenesis protein CcdA/thiol-disulfide isomerase/thioredoxin